MDILQTPRLEYASLMQELHSRAAVPPGNTMSRAKRKATLLKALEEVVELINFAEVTKSLETTIYQSCSASELCHHEVPISSQPEEVDSWNRFIDEAAVKLSTICRRLYKGDLTDCVDPYAIPTGTGRHIETARYLASSIYSSPDFLGLIAPALGEMSLTALQTRMRDTNVIPPEWRETLRPHKLSTSLSRFEPDYDAAGLLEAAHNSFAVPGSPNPIGSTGCDPGIRRQEVMNILQARAEIHQIKDVLPLYSGLCEPEQMVLGKCGLAVSDDTQILKRYAIHPPNNGASERSDARNSEGERIKHGFASDLEGLLIDSSDTIWVSGDCRIKAFGGRWESGETNQQETGQSKLRWTLNSTSYTHAFGVTDDVILRASRGGVVAFWKRDKLVEHDPTLLADYKSSAEPYGGRLNASKYKPKGNDVEITLGEMPHCTALVPNLSGAFGLVQPVPGTSRILCTEGVPESFGIRLPKHLSVQTLDLASPESSATTVGVGFGSAVSVLATHQDLPYCFVAAGDDPCVRIFDMRSSVLPQILLDGHSGDVLSCAIASHGGDFPILFSGGKDELVKAWDIRHTKRCLYELSTATTHPQALAWHDELQSLFVLGKNVHGEGDDWDEDYWPQNAERNHNHFGAPWCSLAHLVIEYRFKTDPDPKHFPWTPRVAGLEYESDPEVDDEYESNPELDEE